MRRLDIPGVHAGEDVRRLMSAAERASKRAPVLFERSATGKRCHLVVCGCFKEKSQPASKRGTAGILLQIFIFQS